LFRGTFINTAANLSVSFTDCPLVKVMIAPVMLSAAPAPLVSNAPTQPTQVILMLLARPPNFKYTRQSL
jgi:hypothetical protein